MYTNGYSWSMCMENKSKGSVSREWGKGLKNCGVDITQKFDNNSLVEEIMVIACE